MSNERCGIYETSFPYEIWPAIWTIRRCPLPSTSVRHSPDAINAASDFVSLAKGFRQTNPMSRGGHNWKGGGTVEGTRSLDVMKLARAGFLSGWRRASWQWTYNDGTRAWIDIDDGRDEITLRYRFRSYGQRMAIG